MKKEPTKSKTRAMLERKLRDELEPGEAVLWQGAPVVGRMVVAMCVLQVGIMIYGGYTTCMIVSSMRSWERVFAPVPYPRTVWLSIGMLWFAMFVGLLNAVKTCSVGRNILYVVTERRAIVLRNVFAKIVVESQQFGHDFDALEIVEKRNGCGHVVFRSRRQKTWREKLKMPGFWNIRNPREVERIFAGVKRSQENREQIIAELFNAWKDTNAEEKQP